MISHEISFSVIKCGTDLKEQFLMTTLSLTMHVAPMQIVFSIRDFWRMRLHLINELSSMPTHRELIESADGLPDPGGSFEIIIQ
jgi:hypothetical protein